MTTLPQTIRRRCSTELIEAIIQGDRTFDLRADNEDIQVGDYYLFVEQRDDDQPPRQVHRRVSYVVRLNSVLDEAQRGDPGLVAVSFVAVDHNRLESILVNNVVIVAIAFEKFAGKVTIIEGPACLPFLATDGLNAYQITDHLGVPTWPDGQYSIVFTAKVTPSEFREAQTIEIDYSGIIIMCHVTEDGEDKLVCVDHRFLLDGALRDLFGREVSAQYMELHDGQSDGSDQALLDRATEIANGTGLE